MKSKKTLMLILVLICSIGFSEASDFGVKGKEKEFGKISNFRSIKPGKNEKYLSPKWSPDGKAIAFSNIENNKIFLYDLATGKTKLLVSDIGSGYKFQWSADSRFIAYRGTKGYGKNRSQYIAYVDVLKQKSTIVSREYSSIQPPWWHYENGKLFLYWYNEKDIEKVNIGSISITEHSNMNNIQAVFSNDHLFITDGNSFEQMMDDIAFDPSFSSDKTKMFYSAMDGLHLLDISSHIQIKIGDDFRAPSWSPNSSWVVLQKTKDNGHEIKESDLFLYNVSSKALSDLIDVNSDLEENPDWSPNGKMICYNTINSGEIIIITIE